MYKYFDSKIDSVFFVKALAIVLVVINHAYRNASVHGGLNGLMLVSGIAMATFAFNSTTAETLKAFRSFILRLAIPSFILALIWAIAYWEFSWPELLFFNNWITWHRFVSFPIWYPQVMLQMLLVLGVIFWSLDLTPKIRHRPKLVTSVMLIIAIVSNMVSYVFWDTAYLHDKLPHLLAWNFLLGWFIWAFQEKDADFKHKLFLSAVVLSCSYLAFVQTGAIFGEMRFAIFSAFALIIIWLDKIMMPRFFAHAVNLVGQATFYIFLWHYPAFQVQTTLASILKLPEAALEPWAMAIGGVLYPVLLWAGVNAMLRTYRKLKH